jgi:hypothetical protein
MKNILYCAVLLYGVFLNALVLASDSGEQNVPVKSAIQIKVGFDCDISSKEIDFVIYMKNKSDESIYFSNGFLGLTPQLLDIFSIAFKVNKKSVAYTGVYEWKRESQTEREQHPYVLEKQKEIFIRYPISKFYSVNFDSDYEVTQTIIYYLPNRNVKFVGISEYSFGKNDCMEGDNIQDNFKSVSATGIYVDY